MLQTNAIARENHRAYASGGDFCRIFDQEMNQLYLLGLLLTAEPAKAEQCFVSGLADCADGKAVFKEWARSWARRTIVQNAIRLMAPKPEYPNRISAVPDRRIGEDSTRDWEGSLHLYALVELPGFDRFVFVMTVLEKYSVHECSLLLGCSRHDVISARERAFGHLAGKLGGRPTAEFLQPLEAA
jgi:DNA-directed RNA polymerase specialized sigma24 family protein